MCDSGIEDFPAVDDDVLGAGMERAAALGLPVAVHAERPGRPARAGGHRLARLRRLAPGRGGAATRSRRAIELARETGCSLHVVHVSSARWASPCVAAVDATCETCPHYLTLTEDDLETLGTRAKCAPPLRTGRRARRAVGARSATSRSSPPTTRRARRR